MPAFTLAHQYNTCRHSPLGLLTDAHHPQLGCWGEPHLQSRHPLLASKQPICTHSVVFLLAERKWCRHGGFNNGLLSTQAGAEEKLGVQQGRAGPVLHCVST